MPVGGEIRTISKVLDGVLFNLLMSHVYPSRKNGYYHPNIRVK